MRDFRESGKIGEKWGKGAKLPPPKPLTQPNRITIAATYGEGRDVIQVGAGWTFGVAGVE